MSFDLYVPFPLAPPPLETKSKGKNKEAGTGKPGKPPNGWDGLSAEDRDKVSRVVGGLGYLGYSTLAFTHQCARHGQITANPFTSSPPYPDLDPRTGRTGKMRQLSRLHLVLDDSNAHGLTASVTVTLSTYDLISIQPTTTEAFSKVCLDLTKPGPNQVGIITLPMNGKRTRGLKRSLIRTAIRNGAVFEIVYSPSLFPLSAASSTQAHQNFLSNAREAIRVIMAVSGGGGRDGAGRRGKGGGGVIFSSGVGLAVEGGKVIEGGWEGLRGPGDLINLAVLLGMPANQAKEAVLDTPKTVILRAQARRAHKGVLSVPRYVDSLDASIIDEGNLGEKKRKAMEEIASSSSKESTASLAPLEGAKKARK